MNVDPHEPSHRPLPPAGAREPAVLRARCAGGDACGPERRVPGRRSAFTLIELLLAMVIFAFILSAITGVFFAAMRLRSRSAELIEAAVPIQHALAVLRHDLSGIVLPSGIIQSNLMVGPSPGDGAAQDTEMAIYTSSAQVNSTVPWSEVQKVAYALRPGTNGVFSAGKDLVRLVTRNLLPPLRDEPEEQRLLSGVERIDFSFYDGVNWRTQWNSTHEATVLPKAVRLQLTLAGERGPAGNANRSTRAPLEIVVPLLLTASTNQTSTAAESGRGAQP